MQSLIRSKSAGVTGGRGTAGAGSGRDLLYRETSESKARTHSYDDLVDLLIELDMERENDSHMDKYLRKHLRKETTAEKSPGEMSPQPQSNPGKGGSGQLKHMKGTPPPMVKEPLIVSTAVLRTIRVDPATRPSAMGEVLACPNCSASRKLQMVRR